MGIFLIFLFTIGLMSTNILLVVVFILIMKSCPIFICLNNFSRIIREFYLFVLCICYLFSLTSLTLHILLFQLMLLKLFLLGVTLIGSSDCFDRIKKIPHLQYKLLWLKGFFALGSIIPSLILLFLLQDMVSFLQHSSFRIITYSCELFNDWSAIIISKY